MVGMHSGASGGQRLRGGMGEASTRHLVTFPVSAMTPADFKRELVLYDNRVVVTERSLCLLDPSFFFSKTGVK